MLRRIILASLCLGFCSHALMGDTLQLADGTRLEGRVIDQGDKYWLKDANGQSRFVDKSSVTTWTKGGDATLSQASSSIAAAPSPKVGSDSVERIKARADRSDSAIGAVALWQTFIDSKPSAADLTVAKSELKHWQEVVDGRGEKINGKWIYGDELKKLAEKVTKLLTDGIEELNGAQTLDGIAKLEQVMKVYPRSFEANFELGYFNLVKGAETNSNAKIDLAVKYLEVAVSLKPKSAATISDLAVGYNFKRKFQLSVETAYKAAQLQDSKEVVQNLINTLAYAPSGMQNNAKIKPILESATLLATKYGIQLKPTNWVWLRPDADPTPEELAKKSKHKGSEEDEGGEPGIFGDGTGFFISSNGYILTNKHVAKPGDYLMVRLPDNTLKLGQRVVLDDEQDMAIIKVNLDSPVPFVRLAAYEHPPVGAEVCVFGFPLLDRFGLKSTVKMTRGIVTAWDEGNELCDVTVDAIVNPGNSGGPMVDDHGNLLALTAMKTISTDGTVSTYGLGYSTERVRKFLKKQADKLTAAKMEGAADVAAALSTEDLATRLTPCTVCILICRGTPPSLNGDGTVKEPTKKDDAGN